MSGRNQLLSRAQMRINSSGQLVRATLCPSRVPLFSQCVSLLYQTILGFRFGRFVYSSHMLTMITRHCQAIEWPFNGDSYVAFLALRSIHWRAHDTTRFSVCLHSLPVSEDTVSCVGKGHSTKERLQTRTKFRFHNTQ